MTYKRVFITVILLVGGAFLLMRVMGGTAELFVLRAFAPLTRASVHISARVQDIFAVFGSAEALTQRIETLEREKLALTRTLARLESVARENEELRTRYGLPLAVALQDIARVDADIIGYNDGATKEWIAINRGTRDGVADGMAVVTRDGIFVGTVVQTTATAARVFLITNTRSTVRGETSTLHTRGIVQGVSNLGARFRMVERSRPLTDGDRVITVRNGAIPARLLIGTIANVTVADDSLFQEATVIPSYRATLGDQLSVLLTVDQFR